MRLADRLAENAAVQPQKKALTDEHCSYTYLEYYGAASGVAAEIKARLSADGAADSKNLPIAVLVGRNALSVIAMLGVSLSGNFYAPIDAAQPPKRIELIMERLAPALVINAAGEEISYDTVRGGAAEDIAGDSCENASDAAAAIADTDEPACAICTSGSAGVPKIVLKSHASISDFIPIFCEVFGLTGDDIFANQASFDHDISGKDIYASLWLGATLHILPHKYFSAPKLLIAEFNKRRVTTLIWAVSAMRVVAAMNTFSYEKPEYLRRVLFSGENMSAATLEKWREACSEAVFANLYGPTEVSYNCTYYMVGGERSAAGDGAKRACGGAYDAAAGLPLGEPFPHQTVRFLTDDGRDIAVGETGEICVSGTAIALGYYHDPERTAESFVTGAGGERLLRTGDMARLGEDGQYYFAGRRDNMIKYRGHRVELEEIERYVNSVDSVELSGCLYDDEKDRLVCVYSGTADRREIIEALKNELPSYMLPTAYKRVDAMPLLHSGKLDRQGLKNLYLSRSGRA